MWYKYQKFLKNEFSDLNSESLVKTIYFRARSIKLVNWYLKQYKQEPNNSLYREEVKLLKDREEINSIDLYIAILRPNNYKIIEVEKRQGFYFNHDTAQYYKQIIF